MTLTRKNVLEIPTQRIRVPKSNMLEAPFCGSPENRNFVSPHLAQRSPSLGQQALQDVENLLHVGLLGYLLVVLLALQYPYVGGSRLQVPIAS